MIGMCGGELRADDVRIVRRCQQAMSGLLLVYVAMQGLVRHRLHGLSAGVGAGVQGAALFGMFVMIGAIAHRRFRGTRTGAMNARALLWGTMLTLFVVSVWGFVEAFAPAAARHLPLLAVPGMLAVFTVLAKLSLLAFRWPVH